MISDPHTKEMKLDYLRQVLRSGGWSILEEGSALQRKPMEREHGRRPEVMFLMV